MTIPTCCNAFAIERVKKWTTLIFAVSTFAWQIQDIVHCLKGSKAVEEKGEKASIYLYVVSELAKAHNFPPISFVFLCSV